MLISEVPMNKIQVGNAPSPNIKAVKSKIGSLDNTTYKPGGGKVKIENRKLDFQNVTPKIAAKNDTYAPSGGSKKVSDITYLLVTFTICTLEITFLYDIELKV